VTLTFRQLHPQFVAEASAIDLRQVHDQNTFDAIRAGMDKYAVLVFREQQFTDEAQLDFAQRFDGTLQGKLARSAVMKNRIDPRVGDISNVDEDGNILNTDNRRRMYQLANRLWHTDASFQNPPGRYSMLSARVVPPVNADTEFADMRAAYDALDAETQARIEQLHAHHSIAFSREVLGFEFSKEEGEQLKGEVQPMVRTNPRSGRRSLYIAMHCTRIVELPVPDGRLFLRDLMEHATQPKFVYAHAWRVGDLVIWDNLATMHRGRYFDDSKHRRELRRVTTVDVDLPLAV
jgi:alpha-ketoglutarate-dependent 2,4-dichlorophenoxyacetate dioxygenase